MSSITTSGIKKKTRVVLLFGPTGVGKTDLLEDVFASFGEVVSADSLQVYRRLDIGTAKPSPALQAKLPHHLIDIRDYTEGFTVGDFCREADLAVSDIATRSKIPVISGGTAFYIKSWLLGLPALPQSNPAIRGELENQCNSQGLESMRRNLAEVDPESEERIGRNDRVRVIRALEVFRQTGRPLSSFPINHQPRDDVEALVLGLDRDREDLYRRIDRRVEVMMDAGLEQEVRTLMKEGAMRDHPGMKGIGYREWFGQEDTGPPSAQDAARLIARNSRRYAKRQMTFFRSLPQTRWFRPDDLSAIKSEVDAFLNGFPS